MSRRRSTSSTKVPATDRDVVMGPPPAPSSSPTVQQDINEKYRKLKRRFFELEEKHKETSTELQRSGERNVKMREERNILLDRIIELENEYSLKSNGRSSLSPPLSSALAQPGSSALPRTLLGARARASFVANLREAVDDPDDDDDPILTSRHVGPEARRRHEEEARERFDDEPHEPRKSARRTRSSLPQAGGVSNHKGKDPSISENGSPHHNASGSRSTPPIASSSSSPSRGHSNHSPLPSTQSHPHLYTHPPPPPPPHLQEQGYNPGQHSSTPEQNGYNQDSHPPSGASVEMDDSAFHYTPSSSHHINGTRASTQDHNSKDRDHRNGNGNVNPNASDEDMNSPALPLRSEKAGSSISTSHNLDSVESSSAPRTRRSSRVAHGAVHHEPDQPEPTRRTRAASKRGNPSSSAVKTRATRRGNAAAATAANDAEVKAPAARQITSRHDSALTDIRDSAASPPPFAPSEHKQQDVQMHNDTHTDATPNQAAPVSTTSVGSAPHPPYLDPALAFQSTAQVISPNPSATAASSNGSETLEMQPSPMDAIVKVAEAAVAAQKAAAAAASSASSASAQPTVQTTTTTTHGSTTSTPTSATTPSSAPFNPYMLPGTATAIKPNVDTTGPGMTSQGMPVSHSMALGMNPYALYYPPGMPMSPNTPNYPYGNPYYYMAPMPSPSGMYPTSPSFVPPSTQGPQSEVQRHAKPKRLKAHTVTSKNFSIPMVPRDKSGKPMLPLNVGIMTVIKLGDVCMREHFHTERYIFPVGYEVSRRYLSTIDPNIEVVYHCTILDGGDGPKFQIIPSDVPDRPVIAGTATGAWSSIVKQANAIRNRQHSNSVSGPDFFGLGQNTIKHLIQELPNADRLRDYVWQRFVEGGPLGGRHAAVIPALPEEFDASHSVGALHYDKQKDFNALAPSPSPKGIFHYPQHIQQQALQQQVQQCQQQQTSGSQGPQESTSTRSGSYYPEHQSSGRTTRNAAASGSGDNSLGSTRNTRSSTRSHAQQPQQPDSAESSSSNTVPATIATLLNAFPSGGPGPHDTHD